jgi:hypothetical protein
MCLLGYKIIFAWWAHIALKVTASALQISSACGTRTKKDVSFGVQNNICLVGTNRPQSGVAAGDAGSSPWVPYKYHPLAVHAPKKMCLLGYKIIFAWWAHIALKVTVRAIQILSACGKRTKKDVPFGVQNNICLVGTNRPQGHRERHKNIIRLR